MTKYVGVDFCLNYYEYSARVLQTFIHALFALLFAYICILKKKFRMVLYENVAKFSIVFSEKL